MALERCDSVPERYKALGELRAAMVVGCEFCVDIGSMIARQSGLTDDELKDLIDWQASERLDEKDKLVLEYADAISRDAGRRAGRAVRRGCARTSTSSSWSS